MVIKAEFIAVFLPSISGLILSIGIERLMKPCPLLRRPLAAWFLHIGLWLLCYGVTLLLLGRPWFAVAVVSALLLTVVLVNNAKIKALREPFIFQDYEYFTDAIRHPRLYIPFLGWWKFLGAVTGFVLAVSVGLWGEIVPSQRFSLINQLGGIGILCAIALLCLRLGSWKSLTVTFNPEKDNYLLGLLASIWRYGEEEQIRPIIDSPINFWLPPKLPKKDFPHLVAIQSESFFDARELYPGIRSNVLAQFDHLKREAKLHGKLTVPAWGANTVRTEFAFLSAIDAEKLGVHRFNPYRAIVAGWNLPSLASYLKQLGYRTICVHPYPASFYRRNRVYPRLGFDEFIDIGSFNDEMRFGPYISDTAVADKIITLLQNATTPIFLLAITMENHGPLHLEKIDPSDIENLYSNPPPRGCEDLTIYLRHLRHADEMVTKLRQALEQSEHRASLCWFGDHVPIMPTVYDIFGAPPGDVEYVIWNNWAGETPGNQQISVQDLSKTWLNVAGLN